MSILFSSQDRTRTCMKYHLVTLFFYLSNKVLCVCSVSPPDCIRLEVSTYTGLNYGLYFASRVYPFTSIAVRTGFEPIQTESKSVMLPLHHLTKHPVFSSHLAQTTVRHRLDFDYRNLLEFLLTGRYHGQTESELYNYSNKHKYKKYFIVFRIFIYKYYYGMY